MVGVIHYMARDSGDWTIHYLYGERSFIISKGKDDRGLTIHCFNGERGVG